MFDLSCVDWQERIRTGQSLIPKRVMAALDPFEVELAVGFFDALVLPDVTGLPLMRDAAGEWFRDIVRVLFGSLDRATMTRWIEEIFALVAKKNSKTTYGAGLMLTALLMNLRPRAEFMLVGPTHAIAELAFSQIAGMVEADPELKKRFRVRDHVKEVVDRLNGAKLKVKTFDLDILTGPRPAGVLLDELHLLGKDPHAAKVIRQLRGGRQATPEGFLIILTTQSDDPPVGAFKDELGTARRIRDNVMPGVMLPILYEFPLDVSKTPQPGVDPKWFDPKFWPMVLPNLGRSLRLEALIQDFNTERAKGDDAIRVWASQHLNVEIGLALRSDRWSGANHWEAIGDPAIDLDDLMARSETVVVGIDGGGLDDLLGLAVLGRDRATKRLLHWGHAWAHKSVLTQRQDIESALRGFEKDGDLTIVERVGDDVSEVGDIVEELKDRGLLPDKDLTGKQLPCVGVDQIGISEIVDELNVRGIGTDRIVGIPQGYKLNGAIKTTERKLAGADLLHGASPLMAWCVSNAKAEARGNAITITKQISGSAKIDPLMALFDAVLVMGANPEQKPSVYEERGLLVL